LTILLYIDFFNLKNCDDNELGCLRYLNLQVALVGKSYL